MEGKVMLQEGIRLFNIKRWEKALEAFLQVEVDEKSNEAVELAYYLGLCYTKLERYDEALLYLERVITANKYPSRVYQCRLALAYVYTITNRAKLAQFELEHVVNTGSETPQLYLIMGFAAWQEKQYNKAIECYGKALKMDERNATALNGLGYILVDTDMNIAQGISFCKKAVKTNPKNAAYLDSLGWAYFKNGNFSEATNWLRKALEAAPQPQQKEIRNHIKIVAGV
ncbi:MAG: tetratricopeptide repeat protein [Treponema sp.]|jgi:tetratricopeptide (TPR) repeat protein|nr:tetratricopeptide repeat protein [Treponema sp.]